MTAAKILSYELLALHLTNLNKPELTALIERLNGAYWLPSKLLNAKAVADKMRREADEIEQRAARDLADELLADWTADEIEAAK